MASATFIPNSPPRRQATPCGPMLFCACGRDYREVRRGVTHVGYAWPSSHGARPSYGCPCGRRLRRFEMSTERPRHQCPACNSDLGLEEFADAARKSGRCHLCPAPVKCSGCRGDVLRGEPGVTGRRDLCIGCFNSRKAEVPHA